MYTLVVLILLSAFFSMSETALVALGNISLRHMLDKKIPRAKTVKKLKDNPHRLLTTILIGNNLVNVAAASIATSVAFQIIPNHAVAASTGALTLIILIFGEIIPKSTATHHSSSISLFVSKPLLILSYILSPIIWLLDLVTGRFVKPAKTKKLTEEDLKVAVDLVEEAGELKKSEADLIDNVFEFDDINVSEIMTPRTDMLALEVNTDLKKKISSIMKAGYTRIPIYDTDLDHIVGILNVKDLIPALCKSKDLSIKKLMYKPFFVPENKKINSMLKQFRKRKEHMAIVVDEHGLVTGLITLENVLEEIVGEIKDETDKTNPHVVKVNKNTWDVLGKSDIEEVNDKIKSRFKESDDYDTISGLILDKLERIPQEEESLTIGKFVIDIVEVEDNRIIKVRIKKK